jgi:hypothetical protein
MLHGNKAKENWKRIFRKFMMSVAGILRLIFLGPYELLVQVIEGRDRNQWTEVKDIGWTGKYNIDTSDAIPLKLINTIQNLHKTSFMSVLLAAYAGGVKAFMVSNGIPAPPLMHCMIPVQLTKKSKDGLKLGNFL